MNRYLRCTAVLALAACSKDAAPRATAGGDTALAAPRDSSISAREVSLTPAQASRIHVATVTMQAYRPVVQTTGTVAFNGDRSTQVLAPVSDMFWGDRWGMIADPFGTVWQVATHKETYTPHELMKRRLLLWSPIS